MKNANLLFRWKDSPARQAAAIVFAAAMALNSLTALAGVTFTAAGTQQNLASRLTADPNFVTVTNVTLIGQLSASSLYSSMNLGTARGGRQ